MTKPNSDRRIIASMSLSPKSIDIIDEKRGREPRSSFVDRLIQTYGSFLE